MRTFYLPYFMAIRILHQSLVLSFVRCFATRVVPRHVLAFGSINPTSLPLGEQFQSLCREHHLSVSFICHTFLRVSGCTLRVTTPRIEIVT